MPSAHFHPWRVNIVCLNKVFKSSFLCRADVINFLHLPASAAGAKDPRTKVP